LWFFSAVVAMMKADGPWFSGAGLMWSARGTQLANGRGTRFAVDQGSSPLSFAEALRGWQTDAGFRSWFLDCLASAPFPAFRWETPSITSATASRPFEFVLLDSPELESAADPEAFAEHFRNREKGEVVEISNLRNDAILVVPCPAGPPSAHAHLGAFVRHAPTGQRHALWERVGAAMQLRLGSRPVWLSTAGAGVAWLHVRLDDRPKYYGYAPYRAAN
jgi:hypothetical protein